MGKTKRKRQKVCDVGEENTQKKIKLEMGQHETTDMQGDNPSTIDETTQAEETLQSRVDRWIQEQNSNAEELQNLLMESHSDEDEPGCTFRTDFEARLYDILRPFTKKEKVKSFKYECEWKKCVFMSGVDRKYFEHVEKHAVTAESTNHGSFECEWDLCDFVASNREEFIGHVHYHGYHTKLKVHGASLSMLLSFPPCNFDSRTRNSIAKQSCRYTCEWDNCGEKFFKAMYFFHHVSNHITDLVPPGEKPVDTEFPCRWSLCTTKWVNLTFLRHHATSHTTERMLACFNCGTMLGNRAKYRDHCVRQVDMIYRKYQCQECDKWFPTVRLLNNHTEEHNKNHPCTLCTLSFRSSNHRTKHVHRVHLKQRLFECSQCDYKGYNLHELNSHLIRHSNTKLFRCDEFGCNEAFKHEVSLKKHISRHYNIPPARYECHCCDKSYKLGYLLSKHLSFVHNLERDPGCSRFRYKLDTDGTFRLGSFINSKRAQAASEKGPADENEEQKILWRAPSVPQKKAAVSRKVASPVKGQTKINSITASGDNQFTIDLSFELEEKELKLATETPASRVRKQSNSSIEILENIEEPQLKGVKDTKKTNNTKKIQDFTVMQRYLKP